jgi:hypothetical protein
MKKTYAAPTLVASGEAVLDTKGSRVNQEIGGTGLGAAPGSVGFYL